MARLGELLLEEKLITPAQLEEALETQVVHGGRLGTNLVEHGFLPEKDLARVLGKQHGMPFSAGEMVPDPQALAVTEPRFLDDHDLLPMRLDATRLTVAVLGPDQLQVIDQLAFRVGKRIVKVVIPEFRMNQLLRKHARAFRPLRPIDMNEVRASRANRPTGPVPVEASSLINEDDFAALYRQALTGAEEPVAEDVVLEGVIIDDAPPEAAQPSPLSFAEAQALLQQSQGREDIATVVLRFARSRFQRALLLSVQGDLVTGWRGLGPGVVEAALRRVGTTLKEANSFQLVRDLRAPFVGPPKRTPGTAAFYKALGEGGASQGYPSTAVMLPLLVRGKPVHILYVDNGPGQVTPPDVGELLIVSQGVTRSYEALIRQRQARA